MLADRVLQHRVPGVFQEEEVRLRVGPVHGRDGTPAAVRYRWTFRKGSSASGDTLSGYRITTTEGGERRGRSGHGNTGGWRRPREFGHRGRHRVRGGEQGGKSGAQRREVDPFCQEVPRKIRSREARHSERIRSKSL